MNATVTAKWKIETMVRIFWILTYFFLTISTGNSSSADSTDMLVGTVAISNSTSIELQFAVKPDKGEWGNYSIHSGQVLEIGCNDCKPESFEFSMSTDGNEVTYTLVPEGRYILIWNKREKKFDLTDGSAGGAVSALSAAPDSTHETRPAYQEAEDLSTTSGLPIEDEELTIFEIEPGTD